jgi:hypothetical protein
VGRLVIGGGAGIPDGRDMAARANPAHHLVGVGGGDVRRRGAAQTDGEAWPRDRALPVGAAAVSPVVASRCEATRAARRRSVLARHERWPERRRTEAPKGPQRPPERSAGRVQWARRRPGRPQPNAVHGVRRGW